LFQTSSFVPLCIPYQSILLPPPSPPTIATNTKSKTTQSSKQTLTMGAKSNASTTGKTAQDSKPTTLKEWKCHHCFLTNEEDMSIAVFRDTTEARQTCIYCGNLHLPSSDRDSNSLYTVFE
jgi:hypothetical protein